MSEGWAMRQPAIRMGVGALLSLAAADVARAHGIAGNRYFDGTLTFDDPAVADEAIVPNIAHLAYPTQGSSVVDNRINWAFARLLTPTLAVTAFEAGQNAPPGPDGKPNQLWSPYTFQFNLSRHPAISVPCGLSRDGLPVGLQIASGHYKDALVLRAAARFAETHSLTFPTLPETMK